MRFSARKSVSSQREMARSMVEKIQYLLILLLFVLTGSLEEISFRDPDGGVHPVLTQSADQETPAAVRNYLSAWTHSLDFQAETPVVSLDHKFVVRQRAAVRSAVEAAFGVRIASCTAAPCRCGSAVDYYVFSLGRILI